MRRAAAYRIANAVPTELCPCLARRGTRGAACVVHSVLCVFTVVRAVALLEQCCLVGLGWTCVEIAVVASTRCVVVSQY